ncbi:MAG: hypothetical protein WA746_21985 [Isosphaeraceae bacterium]
MTPPVSSLARRVGVATSVVQVVYFLPVAQLLQLAPSLGVQGLISGVAGASAATLAFQIWALLDGQQYPCRLQADFVGSERILGLDVLNRLEITFRGPVGEVVVNP